MENLDLKNREQKGEVEKLQESHQEFERSGPIKFWMKKSTKFSRTEQGKDKNIIDPSYQRK